MGQNSHMHVHSSWCTPLEVFAWPTVISCNVAWYCARRRSIHGRIDVTERLLRIADTLATAEHMFGAVTFNPAARLNEKNGAFQYFSVHAVVLARYAAALIFIQRVPFTDSIDFYRDSRINWFLSYASIAIQRAHVSATHTHTQVNCTRATWWLMMCSSEWTAPNVIVLSLQWADGPFSLCTNFTLNYTNYARMPAQWPLQTSWTCQFL